MDVFLRVLLRLDEEIVGYDSRRSASLVTRNQHVRQAMHDHVNSNLIQTLHRIVTEKEENNPALANLALSAIAEFGGWIQPSLIANPPMLNMLQSMLQKRQFQINAAKALWYVVSKRTAAAQKLRTLREMKWREIITSVDPKQHSEKFACKLASIIGAGGSQLLTCEGMFRAAMKGPVDDLDGKADEFGASHSSQSPQQRRGLGFSTAQNQNLNGDGTYQPPQEVVNMFHETTAALNETIDLGLRFMQFPGFRVAAKLLDFMNGVFQLLKKDRPSSGPQLDAASIAQRTLDVVFRKMEYPKDFDFDAPDDDERAFREFRSSLTNIFSKLAGLFGQQVIIAVRDRLMAHMSRVQQIPFAQLEATLYCFHHLPDGIRGAHMQLTKEPWISMCNAIFSSKISFHPHKAISLSYFEIVVRFGARFLTKHPQLLPIIIGSFMDQRGIRHADRQVRSRCCFQLRQFLKNIPKELRKLLFEHVEKMLASIRSVIDPVFGRVELNKGSKMVSFDDALYLCEVVGLLVTTPVSGAKARDYFTGVIGGFVRQLEAGLQQREAWMNTDPALAAKRFSQIVAAMHWVTKQFTQDAHLVPDLLVGSAQAVLQVLILFPSHDHVRQDVLKYFHRMVTCIGPKATPLILKMSHVLLQYVTADDVYTVGNFYNHIALMMKADGKEVLDIVLSPLMDVLFKHIQQYSIAMNDPSVDASVVAAHSSERGKRAELQSLFVILMRSMSSTTPQVFTSQRNISVFPRILKMLALACCQPVDISMNRIAVEALTKLTNAWQESGLFAQFGGPFVPILMQDVVEHTVDIATAAKVDFKEDPQSHSLAADIVKLQHQCAVLVGAQVYVESFSQFLAQRFNCPANVSQQYLSLLRNADAQCISRFEDIMAQCKAHRHQS
jgi:Exportin-T/Exportin 1-like protein